ncbi:MAG: helix-turn-helix domain-containing protein [Lachnospiraceae bacterium]|nr:helix-turn-helix domain-containing protein [Lachnospiraceae bacterium]
MVKEYEPIYTVKEVAKVLKVNPNAVYEYMNTGKLPYLNMGSRKVRGRDLERFINKFPEGGGESRNDETDCG